MCLHTVCEGGRGQSRACLSTVGAAAAPVPPYLSRRSDTRYVWLASMMNISWLMRSSAWMRPSSRPTTVILRSLSMITARNGYVFSRRACDTEQAQTSPPLTPGPPRVQSKGSPSLRDKESTFPRYSLFQGKKGLRLHYENKTL